MISKSDRCELRHGLEVVNDCRLGSMYLKSNLRDHVFLKLFQSEPFYRAPTVHIYNPSTLTMALRKRPMSADIIVDCNGIR